MSDNVTVCREKSWLTGIILRKGVDARFGVSVQFDPGFSMAMFVPHGHKQAAVLNILTNGDRFLLLKRSREPNKGRYTPVGGKMDAFESPAEAAIRETLEETGIKVSNPVFRGVLVDNSPTIYNWICFVYTSEIEYQEPASCPEGTLEWISSDQLEKLPTPVTDMFIYSYILRDQPFVFNAIYDESLTVQSIVEDISGIRIFSGDE